MNALRLKLRVIGTVMRKELLDASRDKRSLISALSFPVLMPLLILAMFNTMIDDLDLEKDLEVAVSGREHAPGLVQWLTSNDVVLEPQSDVVQAVRSRDVKVGLLISPTYSQDFAQSRTATVQVVADDAHRGSRTAASRLNRMLTGYSQQIGVQRLLARGVSPGLLRPIAVDTVDLSTPQQQAANLLMMLPLLLVMSSFMGGMFIATDSTAGERERQSLEPLLLTPVAPVHIMLGKWLATTSFGAFSAGVSSIGMYAAIARMPLEQLGLPVAFSPTDLGLTLAVVLPLAGGMAALQMLIAGFAKSFREAQTYLSLLTLAPTFIGMVAMMRSIDPAPWMSLVPAFGQHMTLVQVLRGDTPSLLEFVATFTTSALLAFVGVRLATHFLTRESRRA